AFAGSSGFKQAKIFASNLNPEMVCIAGVYQLADGISAEDKEGFVEVSLVYDSLIFQANFLEELS
ncbi:MAG TPA: septum site-determining protein MinC, partial [Thiomicrospira sp.]|nr:septum site-determining protein MinC [Thiomicrospira sp.]